MCVSMRILDFQLDSLGFSPGLLTQSRELSRICQFVLVYLPVCILDASVKFPPFEEIIYLVQSIFSEN